MQQGDFATSYYQYYQSYFQNPNPSSTNPNDPFPSTYASAPPLPSDYSNYHTSSTYPPTPQNPDHAPNPPPKALSYSQYSYLHNSQSYEYDQFHFPQNRDSSNFSQDSNLGSTVWGSSREDSVQFGCFDGYGGGGSGSQSGTSNRVVFDDYGRPINLPAHVGPGVGGNAGNVVKAIPKMETQEEDVKSGVQKFRVTLLAENGNQSDTDVLCQIGLDGVQMLDPASGATLRIYPLEAVTRWEVLDESTFAFWARSPIDIELKRIRLKSNSYITNAILDTVTAATVQLKEMDSRNLPSDSSKASDQPMEKKKVFADWMKLVKPSNEEKEHWVPDEAVTKCPACSTDFGTFVRKHHCRNCGDIFCDKCTQGRIALTTEKEAQPVRVCDQCMAEVTQRLSYTREPSGKITGMQSHGHLAKTLKEEMERTSKTSSGLRSDGSEFQMREVACPTCTVHLQIQVPTSGSETIECSVCHHPFLVNAH